MIDGVLRSDEETMFKDEHMKWAEILGMKNPRIRTHGMKGMCALRFQGPLPGKR